MEKGVLFPTISEMYYQHCKDVGMTEQTLKCKRSVLDSQLNPYFQSYPIEDITEEVVEEFKTHILQQNFSKEYNIHIVSTLSSLFKWCVQSNIIPKNICGYSTIFKKIERCSFWSQSDFDKFISYFDDDLMYKTFFTILFNTNLSHSEIRSLTIEDIDLSTLTLSVHQKLVRRDKKGKRERMRKWERKPTLITETIGELLREHLISNHFEIDDPLFPIKYTEVFQKKRESCEFNNIKEISIHSLKNKKNKYIF